MLQLFLGFRLFLLQFCLFLLHFCFSLLQLALHFSFLLLQLSLCLLLFSLSFSLGLWLLNVAWLYRLEHELALVDVLHLPWSREVLRLLAVLQALCLRLLGVTVVSLVHFFSAFLKLRSKITMQVLFGAPIDSRYSFSCRE